MNVLDNYSHTRNVARRLNIRHIHIFILIVKMVAMDTRLHSQTTRTTKTGSYIRIVYVIRRLLYGTQKSWHLLLVGIKISTQRL